MFSQPLKDCVSRMEKRIREMEERVQVERKTLSFLRDSLEESCDHSNIHRSLGQKDCLDCGKSWDFSF